MTLKVPPRLATWLLQRLGPGYCRESLAGDLFEEYQTRQSRLWYWRQVLAAIGVRGTRLLRQPLPGLIRLFTEAGVLLGALALSQQIGHGCAARSPTNLSTVATLIAEVGLCVATGLYLALLVSRHSRATLKRVIGIFAVTALSAGTLTWATSSAHSFANCARPIDQPVLTSNSRYAHGR